MFLRLKGKARKRKETTRNTEERLFSISKMPPVSIPVAAAVFMVVSVAVVGSVTLTLERANHEGIELSRLRDRDRARQGRILQQRPTGVVDFPVEGTYDPYLVGYISIFSIYIFKLFMWVCLVMLKIESF